MADPLPSGFRPPPDTYHGKGDPMDHLHNFNIYMALHDTSDAAMCRALPYTLKDAARTWYTNLPLFSISTFAQFTQLFLQHLKSNRRQKTTSADLISLRHESNESVDDFLARFNATAVGIVNLDQSVAVATATNGMRKSRLTYSLLKNRPSTLLGLLEKAKKYAQAEQHMTARKEAEGPVSDKKRQRGPDNRGREERKRRPIMSTESRPARRVLQGKFDHYTPLTATLSKILEKEHKERWIQWPVRMRADPAKRNRNRFCKFHDDHGHDTDACISLKDMIESRVREGRLDQYVEWKKDGEGRREGKRAEAKEAGDKQPKGVINVIA